MFPLSLFCDVHLSQTEVDFEEQEMSTVGSAFFEDYEVLISSRNKRMWLTPKPQQQAGPHNDFGVSFAYVDGKLVVRKLLKGSDAARYLNVGDEVVSWAGKSYASLRACLGIRILAKLS